ncbi:MAG: ATP-binding cassette domain-containing protein [Romboutsia sp.]
MNILSIKDVCYNVNDLKIINNVSIDIKKGDVISIVGQSGSGKSTLLKLCSDLIPPSSGSIYFDNKCYTSYNPIDLRKKISYCVQIPQLFGKTIYDNLEFPFKIRNEKVDNSKVNLFLNKFGLDEATASLDKENAKIIEKYIKELNQYGVTVLWITHDEEQSKSIFNKRVFISEGKISKVEKII